MRIRVATCSARQLLGGEAINDSTGSLIEGILSIPEYQRPYCWFDTQLENLLLDIEAHREHTPGLPYYLGSLILHQSDGKLNIIDGQQRVTTLLLFASLKGVEASLPFLYVHPTSHQQIKHNLGWLQQRVHRWSGLIDFEKLEFTLVVTRSEDDAYLFFETQNTGGVRLRGPDIIKAHHLRATENVHQARFAKLWESLGPLEDVVHALLMGRHWQRLKFRELPSRRHPKLTRDCIVDELARRTGIGDDVAYGRVLRMTGLGGEVTEQCAQRGYEVRQPLNSGVNTIRYVAYFQSLYERYWKQPQLPHISGYVDFIAWVKGLKGCGYLQSLYEACLLLYISQFGERDLQIAAKKLFRVVYSRRISNKVAVRENSIPAFVRDHPVLDWIALSYSTEQCFSYLDAFKLKLDDDKLDKDSMKKRFLEAVNDQFQLGLAPQDYKDKFVLAFSNKLEGVRA